MKSPDELEKMIKEKGYWVVNIRPLKYKENLIHKGSILFTQYLNSCRIKIRGWDYPVGPFGKENHANIEKGILIMNEDYIPEIWKFLNNGNFYQIMGFHEDHLDFYKEKANKPVLGLFGTLITLTEIFLFAKRLFALEEYSQEDAYVEIQLHGLKDRELFVDITGRFPFRAPKISKVVDVYSPEKKQFTKDELMLKSEDYALEVFADIVRLFELNNIPIVSYKNDQREYLQGRLL